MRFNNTIHAIALSSVLVLATIAANDPAPLDQDERKLPASHAEPTDKDADILEFRTGLKPGDEFGIRWSPIRSDKAKPPRRRTHYSKKGDWFGPDERFLLSDVAIGPDGKVSALLIHDRIAANTFSLKLKTPMKLPWKR